MNEYDAEYLVDDDPFEQKRARLQNELVSGVLDQLENAYLSREKLYKKILESKKSAFSWTATIDRLDLIDAVRENVKTSLLFGNYRRATWYLRVLDRMCRSAL